MAGSASFVETPLVTQNVVIAPQSTIELTFGIDRAAMGGAPDALFASMVRFTDAANEFDILIPAVARKSSLAGLWIGEALVSAVESKAQADTVTPTKNGYPLRYIIHVSDDGTARILSQVFLGNPGRPAQQPRSLHQGVRLESRFKSHRQTHRSCPHAAGPRSYRNWNCCLGVGSHLHDRHPF